MAKKKTLSLQSLHDMLEMKADKEHTHKIVGSIESALYLDGVPADKFVRNDLALNTFNSDKNNTAIEVKSRSTDIKLEAGDKKTHLYIDTDNSNSSILNISGTNNKDVYVNVTGGLYVNGKHVPVEDANIGDGEGNTTFVVSENEPLGLGTNDIWAHVIDEDQVFDTESITGTSYMYTVPIGSIVETIAVSPPDGYIFTDGQLVSRTIYAGLWQFVKKKSYLVSDKYWLSLKDDDENVEYYSKGDELLNFRVPYIKPKGNIRYMIKAYEDVTVRDITQIGALTEAVRNLSESQTVTGVGYIKYGNGVLIQYGSSNDNIYEFSVPFVDTDYSVTVTCEGPLQQVYTSVSSDQKAKNGCLISVFDSTSQPINNIKTNYIAVGKWKQDNSSAGQELPDSTFDLNYLKRLVEEYCQLYGNNLTKSLRQLETNTQERYESFDQEYDERVSNLEKGIFCKTEKINIE